MKYTYTSNVTLPISISLMCTQRNIIYHLLDYHLFTLKIYPIIYVGMDLELIAKCY